MASRAAKIHLCGDFEMELAGRELGNTLPRGQLRMLCAYLVLNRDRSVTRDELAAAIWPVEAPPRHQGALSALLSRLRRALGDDAALEGRSELRLVLPGEVWVDVEAAERAVAEAELALDGGHVRAAWAPASLTLGVVERGLLPAHDAPWLDERRRDLDELGLRALECIARVGLDLGGSELAGAERAARRLIERAPYRESGYRFLMQVHEARGDVAEALRIYERLRVLLREELGTTPAADLQEHHARLLALGDARPAAAVARQLPPLPPALRLAGPFVGRDELLAQLRASWDLSQRLESQTVVVGGEAGIGKTRLCAELAHALEDEATVLYGRSDEEGTVPYQPFVEALGHYVASTDPDELREELAGRGGDVARLVPDLHRIVPDLPAPIQGSADTDRYRLFEETAAVVEAAARSAPLLIVLDDLHWADRATLHLLRHLARARMRAPLMLLATYRATEVARAEPLAGLLADLRREQLVTRLSIEGLGRTEVGELISLFTGQNPPAGVAQALYEETEGNPFFLGEVLRHLGERGAAMAEDGPLRLEDVGVPEGVREVVDRRLGRLGEPAVRALREASVIGREFDLPTLARVSGREEDELLDAIDEGVSAHLVVEVPGTVGRYSFSHALVRSALYDALGGTRRARLHRQVGDALEELHADALEPHLAEIAHHYSRADGAEAAAKTIAYSSRAGREALRQLAYDEALAHCERALSALGASGGGEDERCRLLIELGRAQNRAGESDAAKRTFQQAADLASSLGDAAQLTRAALGYSGPWLELGTVDPERLELLERALEAVGPEDSARRAGLLSRLALELYYTGPDQRETLSREAVDVARRLGDGVALARALMSRRVAIAGSPEVDERLAVTAELIQLATLGGATETALWGHIWRATDLLEKGDMEAAYAEFAAYGELARGLRQPAYLWQIPLFDAVRALFEGRFEEIEALIAAGVEIGRSAHDPNAANYFGIHGFMLRWAQGRLAEVEEAVSSYVERYPAVPAWRCGLVLLYAELGRDEDAARELDALATDGFAGLPEDINWLPAVTWLAMGCGRLGDAERAATLYELLEPHAARNVASGHPIFCLGAVSHYLGVLATTAGRPALARPWLEDALERNERMGSPPLVAHTRHELARALTAEGREEDRERAEELLRLAADTAAELGMASLAERAASGLPPRFAQPS